MPSQPVGLDTGGNFFTETTRHRTERRQEKRGEEEVQRSPWEERNEQRAEYGAGTRRQFEEDPGSHVRQVVAHIGSGSSAGGRDDRHDAGTDGEMDVQVKSERQERNDENAATQSDERAEQTGEKGKET